MKIEEIKQVGGISYPNDKETTLREKIYENWISPERFKEFIENVLKDFAEFKINPQDAYKKPYQIYKIIIEIIKKRAGKELGENFISVEEERKKNWGGE